MDPRILVVHSDKTVRKFLEAMCSVHHEAISASDIKKGLKLILKIKPTLVVVGLDAKKKDALQLLRYMRQYGSLTPVVVVAGRAAGSLQMSAMKAGAKGFVEFPVDQKRFDREISRVLQDNIDIRDAIPPITKEEEESNRTELELDLNRKMKCPSGKNQVHLQSQILGLAKTKPRIALECPLRLDFAMKPTVYYEYIRDICCSDPSCCEAVQQFRAKNSA